MILRRRFEPALTRKPGDLPVAVVFRADRGFRANGGKPDRRHVRAAYAWPVVMDARLMLPTIAILPFLPTPMRALAA